ncbi:MAG TPA: LysR family transcriptional regulator [Alphaproteobacteria bacterium]|nr:LysR family transcriptional regulator [Alphaproteobacteria bacterium]
MDRLDAMRAFVLALDEGSLAAAGRRLGRSPPAMTRAVAALEMQIGTKLFERKTRIIRLTEAGERYAAVARRILAELDEINLLAAGEAAQPRGLLTVTAPVVAGAEILRPCLDDYLDAHPQVCARLLLLDRFANLVEEGIDVALRIGQLSDSALVAMRVGSVRRVVCASPAYLKRHAAIRAPGDLAGHRIISLAETRQAENWSFASRSSRAGARVVRLAPRLLVNNIAAARGSAMAGKGVTRLLSYQVAEEVCAGRLAILLEKFEPAPMPVHLVAPRDRLAMPKTRAFVDFVLPRLKAAFAAKSID